MAASMGKEAAEAKRKEAAEKAAAAEPPAKKKPAGKTIPGGALHKKKPPPKKPAAGRKRTRKLDSDESESDASSQDPGPQDDSSSSDEDPAPRAVPAKKRAKPAPAPAASDSEESTFEDEYDDELYKGPEDRAWMLTLNELEREAEVAKRLESRQIAKEAWELKHQRKKQAAAAPRQQRRKVEPDSRKKAQKAALDDMANRKKEQKKKVRRDDDDSDDEEQVRRDREKEREERERSPEMEEEREERPSRKEPTSKPRHKQAPQDSYRNAPMIKVEQMEEIRVPRSKIIEYIKEPFFDEFILDMFVRIHSKKPMVCQVKGVSNDKQSYDVEGADGKPIPCTKMLLCVHAGQKKEFAISYVSNRRFQADEVAWWCRNIYKDDKALPDEEDLAEYQEKLSRNWKETFVYDDNMVETMIRDGAKNSKRPVNVALSKMHLQEERDLAWEEYKTLDDEDEKNTAYERWEKLREQVQEMEDLEEEQKQALMQIQAAGLHKINSRAQVTNRSVDKSFKIHKNELSSRPYIRTTYWAMPTMEGEEEEAAAPSPRPGEAPMSAGNKALNVDTGAKKGTFLGDDDEENDTPRGAAPAAGRGGAGEAMADATSRAHRTELAVQVDTSMSKSQAAKKDDEPTLPIRAVNPLKPAAAAPSTAASGKTSLSLEEYKRRRGMLTE